MRIRGRQYRDEDDAHEAFIQRDYEVKVIETKLCKDCKHFRDGKSALCWHPMSLKFNPHFLVRGEGEGFSCAAMRAGLCGARGNYFERAEAERAAA